MAHEEEDFSESSLWMPDLMIASLLVPLRKISEAARLEEELYGLYLDHKT